MGAAIQAMMSITLVLLVLDIRVFQIATFVLPFPKTPMLPRFDAIMAIWPLWCQIAIGKLRIFL